MKRALLAAVLFLAAAGTVSAEIVEAILARVGDRIITRTQYLQRLQDGDRQIEETIPPPEVAARKVQHRDNLFNEMVSELLLKDRADRLGFTVTEPEVQDAVKRLKAQYAMETDQQFEESLRQSGLTRAEMEARLRDTILTNKVFQRELRSREELTDKELRERYEREKDQYRLPERAKVREIIVILPENATEEAKAAARARAADASERAQKGEDFAKLVTEFSGAPSKDRGGDLGVVARGEMLPPLDSGVFISDAGSVLGPIETRFGYHILQIQERLPSELPGFDSVKDRLRKEAGEETYQRDYKAYIERLRKEAFVQIHEENIPKV